MKKCLSLVLILLLTLGLLAGCGSDGKSSDSSTGGDGTVAVDDSMFSTDKVSFVAEDGSSIYRIVRPDGEKANLSVKIYGEFNTNVGVKPKYVEDKQDGTDAYEILVGETNRTESQKAKRYLIDALGGHSEDFIVASIGKKIVILGMGVEATEAAADYFIANFLKKDGVDGGIKYTYKTEGDAPVITLNGTSLADYKIIRQHYNGSYLTQMQIEELISSSKTVSKYTLNYYEDAYVESGDYEIVVGNANREGVEKITNADEYKITISGKKVFLNGGSPQATAMAVSEFSKLLKKGPLTDADSVTGTYSAAVASYDKSKYYTLAWGDDFNGDSIDRSLWYVCSGTEYSNPGFNNRTMLRSDKPEHLLAQEGTMIINSAYDDKYYYGALLMTDRTMLYKYGYVEMSAILPKGDGLWTSLWLDSRWHSFSGTEEAGKLYDQEIDVNECFGNSTTVAANCHKWPTAAGEQMELPHTSLDTASYASKKKRIALDDGDYNNEFHTFGYFWDEDECTFTCDGEVYFSYTNNTTVEDQDGFHTLCYLRLSAAVGHSGNPLGRIIADDDPAWGTTNKMIVDYVHVYQVEDGKQEMYIGDEIRNAK